MILEVIQLPSSTGKVLIIKGAHPASLRQV